jgi:choline-sulfatase
MASPNVLLLLGGQHNHRSLGRREDSQVSTSALDSLATDGVDFERAYAPAPSGTPSRIGLLTGRTVPNAGAWDRHSVLDPDLPTLPATLSAVGYETCLIGSVGLGGDRQFAGFDNRPYGDLTGTGGHQYDPLTNTTARGSPGAASGAAGSRLRGEYSHRYDPLHPGRKEAGPDPWQSLTADAGVTDIPESLHQERIVEQESTAFLREHHSDDPWFLCVSFNSPHYPLTAPRRHLERYDDVPGPMVGPGVDADDHPLIVAKRDADGVADLPERETVDPSDRDLLRRARTAYFACVSYLDEIIGDLLRSLEDEGMLENTIVVYAGDHGQLVGNHGLWWAETWHEAALRVPMLLSTHGDDVGRTISTPVSLLDLYPTICKLCGVAPPDGLDGTDLSAATRGGDPDRGPVVADSFSETYGEGTEFRAVVDGDDKYVRFRDAPDRRFDLAADPGETRDLSGEDGGTEVLRHAEELDFSEALERRERDRAARTDSELAINRGTTGNAFLLDDRRLVDADVTLYKPDLLAEDPEVVFEDWPDAE